jgi:hypothetical protein
MRSRINLAACLALLCVAQVQAGTDAATILAANKAATGDAGEAAVRTELALSGQGMTGTDVSISDAKDGRSVDHQVLGPSSGASGFDGHQAWEQDSSGAVNIESGGDALPLAINNAYRNANLWWLPDFGGARVVVGTPQLENGALCDVLTITPRGGAVFDAWFDQKTHLLARTVEKQGPQTVTVTLSDYRSFKGEMMSYKAVVDTGSGEKYLQTETLTKVEFLPKQPDATYAPPKVAVTDFSLPAGKTRTSFPFQLLNNHIYADVAVNGKGPLLFIFDTGGHDILTPDSATAMGVKVEGAMPGTGVGDQAKDFGLTKVDALKVGDATFVHQVFGVLDFVPQSVEGVDLKGMIGFEVFKRFVTRIDYGSHTITLMDPKDFDPADAGTPVPFVMNAELPQIEGSFEGIAAKFDVDTGARDELTLTAPFAESNGLRAKHPHGVEAVDGWGVGGSARGYIIRGGEVKLGSVAVPQVVTSLSLQKRGAFSSASYQGNVGGGLLKRFVVTFDYGKQIMYLKKLPEPIADVDVFDRSGMWINSVSDGVEVMDVSDGGAAQAAGLHKGDVITAIDGKQASAIPVYRLREAWRDGKAGTVVSLTVRTGDAMRAVRLTLRDQI